MALTKKEKRQLLESEKYGIEELKKIQVWKADLIEEIFGVIQKHKKRKAKNPKARVSAWVLVLFIDDAIRLSQIMSQYEQIGKEFKDLSDDEHEQLNQIFRDELDLDDEKAEELAERTNALSLHVADYIEFVSEMK